MRLIRYYQPNRQAYYPAFNGLASEFNRLVEGALGDFAGTASGDRLPVDISEDKDNVYVSAAVPGIKRDDINIEVADGSLTITATRKTPATEGQPEESYSFGRTVALTERVQADKIAATYQDGVLTITLPKREETKPRRITLS